MDVNGKAAVRFLRRRPAAGDGRGGGKRRRRGVKPGPALACLLTLPARRTAGRKGGLSRPVARRTGELERLAAETRLAAEKYQLLFENFSDGILVVDPADGRLVDANRSFCSLAGYPAGQLRGMNHLDLYEPGDRPAVQADFEKARSGGGTFEHRLRRADGRTVPVEISTLGHYRFKGRPLLVGSFRDISARLALQRQVAENERLLSGVARHLPGAIFRGLADEELKTIYISEGIERITGFPAADFIAGRVSQAQLVHPEDRTLLRTVITSAARDRDRYDHRYRIRDARGQVRWVREIGRGIVDDAGNTHLDGIVLDYDEQARTGEALGRKRSQMIAVFDAIEEIIYVADPESHEVLYANRHARKVVPGIVGATCYRALHGRETPCEFCHNRRLMEKPDESHQWHFHSATLDRHYLATGRLISWDDGRPARFTLAMDITTQKKLEAKLAHDALHDPLTGLPNRALLLQRLKQAIARARRKTENRFLVVFIDLDDFKKINDTLGHTEGDNLLRQVAGRLSGCLRQEDTLSRLGGDEFAVLIEDLRADASGEHFVERLLTALRRRFVLAGREVHVSASLGACLSDGKTASAEQYLGNADLAMYRAKRTGKNRLAFFDPGMNEAVNRKPHG